jgi:hypothetical protein
VVQITFTFPYIVSNIASYLNSDVNHYVIIIIIIIIIIMDSSQTIDGHMQ